MRTQRRFASRLLRVFLAASLAGATSSEPPAWGQAKAEKGTGGFADPRLGDVPEGAAEMVTEQTDRAIKTGLAWLSRNQNADGSYGNGTYRGNIAVTSLAGLAFMASGSSPGRGPYGRAHVG